MPTLSKEDLGKEIYRVGKESGRRFSVAVAPGWSAEGALVIECFLEEQRAEHVGFSGHFSVTDVPPKVYEALGRKSSPRSIVGLYDSDQIANLLKAIPDDVEIVFTGPGVRE